MTTKAEMEQSTGLARRHRPRGFEGAEGPADQGHIAGLLKRAVVTGRIANAYLLAGPRGVGKTTLARVLAAALNCPSRESDGEPCGTCEGCRSILAGRLALDVVEIDAASNRGVDDARALREAAMYAPSMPGRWKVYIIDEAHMLTKEAWNALLKDLEEPKPHVVYIACTTEPERIASISEAVMSRFQRHDFRRVSETSIADRLGRVAREESIRIDAEALSLIAHLSHGGMRDALTLLEEVRSLHADPEAVVTADDIRRQKGIAPEILILGALDVIFGGAGDRNRARAFDLLSHLSRSGHRLNLFLLALQQALVALLALRGDRDTSGPWTEKARARLLALALPQDAATIARILDLALQYREDVAGAQGEVALFTFIQQAISLADTGSAADGAAI